MSETLFLMRRAPGVTLLETIIVIAIMAILAGMFLPVLGNARRKAVKIYCQSQIGQIEAAVSMYNRDNERRLPRSWLPSVDRNSVFLPVPLGRYVGGEVRVFRCPSDTDAFTDRPPPNEGRSFFETEQSSYSYMLNIGVAEYEAFHAPPPQE